MSDHDPYVGAPTEPTPPRPGDGLRPWLALAIVLVLLSSMVAIRLVDARQDPSLQLPEELLTPDAPSAPSLDGS